MFVHGGVTLRFDSTRRFEFTSRAEWPRADRRDAEVRMAVEKALVKIQGDLEKTQVVRMRIQFDKRSSSKLGFGLAAEAATRADFDVK
jgi:hypothetical protein